MADAEQFKLPDVGEGLTEGEILQWLVAVGDTVTVNQPLCEVETAKAAVELPSPYAGTVTELLFEAGTMVDVGTPIITIDVGGGRAPAPAAPRPPSRAAAEAEPAAGLIGGAAPGGRTAVLVGYGPRNTEAQAPSPAQRRAVAARATAPQVAARGRLRLAAPTARRCWPPRPTPAPSRCGTAASRSAGRPRRTRCAVTRPPRPASRTAAAGCGRWPSRRCASTPRTSAST